MILMKRRRSDIKSHPLFERQQRRKGGKYSTFCRRFRRQQTRRRNSAAQIASRYNPRDLSPRRRKEHCIFKCFL